MSLGSPGSPGPLGIASCYYENSEVIMAPGSEKICHPWSRSFEGEGADIYKTTRSLKNN